MPRTLALVWTVAVLGPVEVRRDDEPVVLPAGRTTEVLVRLALDVGRVVRTERLLEDVWAQDAATTGRNTLQSKVSQLRRALGAPEAVVAANGGYRLAVDPAAVDAQRVVGLAAAAGAAARAGDPRAALEAAAQGLALFRGEVLMDAGDGAWLQPHRARLEELRLGLLEDDLAARVALGAGGDVVGRAEALVEEHPLRERLWAALVTALYRSGRQADALAAYARVRRLLADELGLEPGPELRLLEEQVLQQSPDLAPTGARATAGARAPAGAGPSAGPSVTVPSAAVPAPGNLPGLSTALVGRAPDVADLRGLLTVSRLVTVVGPAGVGKSRVALEVARSLSPAGGVWLVRLDAADRTSSVGRLVAETLQVAGGEPMLSARLREAPTTLLLDGCEHLVDDVAALVPRLLDAAPGLVVLTTSQVPLGLDGEEVHVLDPLSVEDSVALFAARASRLRRGFVLDGSTTQAVEHLCRSLDGLPLAIELAAARVRSLSVQEIGRRLDDRFGLLRDPTGRGPDRRRALSAAIGWSYDLLFPDDQRGLWALACFSGGAPLAAAEHVLAALDVPEGAAVDVVARLAERSLVGVDVDPAGAVRYRLLDSIRAYALERLHASGAADAALSAHAGWFAQEAERCGQVVRGPGQAGCVRFALAERANVDAALAWTARHEPVTGLRTVLGLGWVWVVLGDGVAGARRVRDALAAAAVAAPDDRARALLTASWLEASAGNVEQGEADLLDALALAAPSDDRLRADARRHEAFLRIQQGRPAEVLAAARDATATYRGRGTDEQPEHGSPWDVGAALLLEAYGSLVLGDVDGAARCATTAVRLLRPSGDPWGLVHADGILAVVAQAQHRLDDAAQALTRAADRSQRLGFLGQAALHLTRLGRVQHRAGRTDEAAATFDRATEAARTAADLRMRATALTQLGRLRRAVRDVEGARTVLDEADSWYRGAGAGEGALLARCLLLCVTADAAAGRDDDVAHGLAEVLAAALDAGDGETATLARDRLARLAADDGDTGAAADLLRAADATAAQVAHLLDASDRLDARAVRTALGLL